MVQLKSIFLFASVFALICITVSADVLVGGLKDEREPDDEVRKIVQSVKSDIEEKSGEKYASIEPLKYRKQIVAGANYFVKAAATKQNNNEKSYLHLRIYRPFKGTPLQLTAMLKDVQKEKPLEHF